MMNPQPGRLRRYSVALVAAFLAFAATYITWPLLKPTPWAFFFAAVLTAAWFGGFGPSLLATAASILIGQYFFLEPFGSFQIGPTGIVPTLVFLLVSLFIGLLASSRRQAESFERAERRRFQATVSSIGDAVIATDGEGRVTFMNGIAQELTGWDIASARGKRLEDVFVIVNETTREAVENPVAKVLETGRIQGLANHTILIARDGSERPIDDSAAPIRDDSGELVGVVLVFHDVTEKRKAAKALAYSEALNRNILESITDAFFALDQEWRFTYVNPQAEVVLGREPGDLLGNGLLEAFPGVAGSEFERSYRKAVDERVAVSFTSYYPDHDRWYEVHAYPAVDGLSVYFRNVTERRRTEEALKVSEEQLRLTLESTGLGAWHFDPATSVLITDERFRTIFGISGDQLSYDETVAVIHPEDQARVRSAVAAATRPIDPEPYAIEYRVGRPDGDIRWIFAKGKPNHDGERLLSFDGTISDITERKTAEEDLKASEERYRALFNTIDEGFCVIDVLFEADRPVDYRFLEMNPAFEKHTGLRDVTGKTVLEAVPEHETLWIDAYGKVALTGEPLRMIHEVKVLGRWFEVSAIKYGNDEGRKVAVLFNDISDRMKAEQHRERLLREFQTEKERLVEVFRRAPSFMCVLTGPEHIFEMANDRYCQLVGHRDILGKPVLEALPEIKGQGFVELLDAVYRTGQPYVGTDVAIWLQSSPDGPMEKRYLDFVYQALRDTDGDVTGILAQGIDLTERKRAEQEVRSKTERVNLLVENIKDYAVVIADAEGMVLEWQGGAERITGYSPVEAIGQSAHLLFTPEDRADGVPEKELGKAAATGRAEDKRWHLRKGGTRFYADGVMTALYDDYGKLRGFGKVFKDATDAKEAEESTKRRASQLQRLADIATRINSAHDVDSVLGVVTSEARLLIEAHQAATSMMLNPSHPQPINVVSNSAKHPEGSHPPSIDRLMFYEEMVSNNEAVRLTKEDLDVHPMWRADHGEFETVNGWLAAPLVGRNGKSMGLIQISDKQEGHFTVEDEAILVQLSQLAAIAIENARLYQELRSNDERKDEFLAMLAHELRNPLAAIGNAVKLASKSEAREHLEWSNGVITRQMQHLSRLIDDLMDVSRITRGKIVLRRDVTEATPILESAAATVRTLVEERKHTLELDIDRGNLWVDGDPTRLEQVVVNLLNNAAKYSENAGHIWLSARVEDVEVVISVRDSGVGIPPERLPEMFELFAQGDRSLARSEGGLGIGLTVVKKLVEMHGGSITAQSEGPGKGSEFVIHLPRVQEPILAGATGNGQKDQVHRKSRILVVDDNVDTARGMARLLKLVGHEVATAHDGHEAIHVAREFEPEFIMLDIGLPGMSGYEVAAKLRKESCCEDAMIVAVSGYGQEEDRRRSREAGFDFHLTKPVDLDALLALLSHGANGQR
ncbi:hybrid sensor histidine kinase/response regulator [Singulisphaera rosea]